MQLLVDSELAELCRSIPHSHVGYVLDKHDDEVKYMRNGECSATALRRERIVWTVNTIATNVVLAASTMIW